jgi:2-oxoglutarate ferredoxin oxidoreductase subunit gamma
VEAGISRGDITIVRVPANQMADSLRNAKSANMVMLGTFIKKTGLVSISTVLEALRFTLSAKKKLIEINERALEEGYNFFK